MHAVHHHRRNHVAESFYTGLARLASLCLGWVVNSARQLAARNVERGGRDDIPWIDGEPEEKR